MSTEEALGQLANESYDLVITDLGREHPCDTSATAGTAFLDPPIVRNGGPPVIVAAGTWAVAGRDDAVVRGARGRRRHALPQPVVAGGDHAFAANHCTALP